MIPDIGKAWLERLAINRNRKITFMKYTNVGSYSTAIANGMKKVKEYPDPKNTISYVYAITREEWKSIRNDL